MNEKKSPLYLLDGYSLIYRSYFAFMGRPMTNSRGENVSVVFQFFRTLFAFFDNYAPDYLAVVMDPKGKTFRHEKYPDYKANREKAPEDLHSQTALVEEILAVMKVPVLRREGYEADDLIASLAAGCRREERSCYIISGDKDLAQLVDGRVRMLRPDKGGYSDLGPGEVQEKWGVPPEQILDYLALTGDQADNIPGVRGIGPKTAVNLLTRYPTLEAVYAALEDLKPGTRKKLEAGRDEAFLSRDLIRLEAQLDLAPDLGRLAETDFRKGLPFFQREELPSLVTRLGGEQGELFSSAGGGSGAGAPAGEDKAAPVRRAPEVPQGLPTGGSSRKGEYQTVLTEEELREWLERARRARIFAFDVETDSLDEMVAEPLGFSLAVTPGEACYIPLVSADGEHWEPHRLREALKPLLTDKGLKLTGQNFKYDYKVLSRWGIKVSNLDFDTMVAAWLLDASHSSFGMDQLARRVLGYETTPYRDVVPKKGSFRDVPLDKATLYAAEDADITLRLRTVFEPVLRQRGVERLFCETEMPLIELLARMELRGIGLDRDALDQYSRELAAEREQLESQVYSLCGREFNLNSTKQLQGVLFEERGLTPVKKTKTGFSTDVSVLEELAREDPVPQLILEHRVLSKLKSTYVDALPELINPATGRLHTRFSQTGTATGRLSSRDPNLQNIPIRDERGRRIRKAFVPRKGCVFISADYAQIELVILAHLSGDPELQHAFVSGEDVHRRTAALIFGKEAAEISDEERRTAKTINFGVMYGMSGFRLARDLGIPRKQADHFISSYFSRYAKIREYMDTVIAGAEERGYVETMLGHRRIIPGINSRNRTEKQGAERVAVNTPIQGSAADVVKVAMLALERRLSEERSPAELLLQVHDELILEVPAEHAGATAELVRATMEEAVELTVPLRVSVETGGDWGGLH